MPASRGIRLAAALVAGALLCAGPVEAQVQPPQPSDQSLHEAMQQLLRTQYIKETGERADRARSALETMRGGLSAANRRSFDQLSAQLRTLGVATAAARLQPALSPAERTRIVAQASDFLTLDRTLATDLHFEYADLTTHAGLPRQPSIPPKPDAQLLTDKNAALLLFQLDATVANQNSGRDGAIPHGQGR